MFAPPVVKIAISACVLYPDPIRNAFAKKTLHYIESSVPEWLSNGGALPVMVPIPSAEKRDQLLAHYALALDGLVLHGGIDVAPSSYGEAVQDPRWAGDPWRDAYEMALLRAFVAAGKPVFGICRGLQLINVCFGGSLVQDIATQKPDARQHRDADRYDQLFHALEIAPDTRLSQLLNGLHQHTINSVHHQCIKQLASGFIAEAHCPDDGTIEAIRATGTDWIAGVQWHPEFHRGADGVLNDAPLLADFLAQAARVKQSR